MVINFACSGTLGCLLFGAILVTSCLIQVWADDRELKMVAVVVKYEVVVDDVVRRSAAVFIVNDLIFFFFHYLHLPKTHGLRLAGA